MEVKKEVETNINIKLRKVAGESARTRKPFIYKVHDKYLHNKNDKVYEPEFVAIGPYHRDKQRLNIGEQLKHRYLISLLVRKNEKLERYISAAAEMEQAVRNCYSEYISLSAVDFVEMLVLDSCFIVEFLLHDNSAGYHDAIVQMEWVLISLSRDLRLFENQIPFFLLCKMFDLIYGPRKQQALIEALCCFFGKEDLWRLNWKNRSPTDVKHLLHLTHIVSRPSSDHFININDGSRPCETQLIRSATELKDANISFLKIDSTTEYEVDFNNGTLTMPALTIHDGTERSLRNSIIFEQHFPGNQPTYVTDYMLILDCLVDTSRDVEFLSHRGIINNMMGDYQEAADIINRLGRSVVISSESNFIYKVMFANINAHYERPWNRAWAALHRDYFNTPWAYISFFGVTLLLLLTVAQTVLSALQL